MPILESIFTSFIGRFIIVITLLTILIIVIRGCEVDYSKPIQEQAVKIEKLQQQVIDNQIKTGQEKINAITKEQKIEDDKILEELNNAFPEK
jgi:hypothetical protein